MPSVLFFLATVVPSIWILSLDEASRKTKFNLIADNQESKIKNYVLSLDDMINNVPTASSDVTMESLLGMNVTARASPLKKARSLNDDEDYTHTFTSTMTTSLSNSPNKKSKSKNLLAEAKKFFKKNVECCDVNVSYWFEEDNLQHLFLQSLMIILIASRWLITRAELNLNQRSLILVISIAVAADICDFFSYLNLELIYSNSYLIYSLLLILSLSLIQFIFLHVEDSLNMTRSFTSSFNSSSENTTNPSTESDTNSSSNGGTNEFIDTDGMLKKKKKKKAQNTKKSGKTSKNIKKKKKNANAAQLFAKHYNFLKERLKADPTIALRNGGLVNTRLYDSSKSFIGDNITRHHQKQQHQAAIINSFPLAKNKFTKYLCNIFCCCIEHKDPLFFILLAGLILHDGSYLAFRIFILCKLGIENTLSLNPLLIFFMVKNFFIIITQIYKVYQVTSEKRQLRYLENYRGLIMNTQQQQQQHQQQQQQIQQQYKRAEEQNYFDNHHYNQIPPNFNSNRINKNHNNNNNNFLTAPHNAAIAAAATGGQVPLVNQHYQHQQHYMYQPTPVTNPYRFAQAIYGDTTTAKSPDNFNRSCSTLGDANTAFFANEPNTLTSPITRYSVNKANTLPHHAFNLNDTSITSTTPGNYNQTFQSQSFYQNPGRGGVTSGNSLNSPLPDSLLAIMNNDNNNNNNYYAYKKYQHQHNYDQNITLCQSPHVTGDVGMGIAGMTTPMNPFSAKVGKALYGLPFVSRSKSSLAYGMNNQVGDQYNDHPNFAKISYSSAQKFANNSNKMMKASKI